MICILYLGAPQLSASEPLLQMNQCTIGYRPFVRPLEEIDVGFNRHIQLTENATATVNCDGQPVAVRTYPADPSCGDWDLGCARPLFETGDKIKFENGVHYSLVLPAGSVCTFREDITNEEAVLNFVGSYTEPVEQIRYEWCSLFDNPKIEVIGEVSFRYNTPVIVVENSKMQLYTADGTTLVKEADMFLDTSINCFVVKADFGGIAIPEEGFTIVIPEGSIISDMGEIAVNPRHTITVGGSAGIKPVFVTDRSDAPIYDMQGRKVTQPVAGQIYIQANRKFRAQAQ